MSQTPHQSSLQQSALPNSQLRLLAQRPDWSVTEYTCTAGPGDRPFEERREHMTIAAVLEGTFTHRSDTGTALLHPGAILLGNAGACFECGHDHSRGDRCIAFQFTPGYFAEFAASIGGSSALRFTIGMLPARASTTPWLARVQAQLKLGEPLAADEAMTELLALILRALPHSAPTRMQLSARDRRRVQAAVEIINGNAGNGTTLDNLAAAAGTSKFHFLRIFRAVTGMTPYQMLLSARLRNASTALLTSDQTIGSIAFDAGFSDLSTFNRRFRSSFGCSPSAFRSALQRPRRQAARAAPS